MVIRIVKSFFSVEFIFSLFLLAGWLKNFINFPVDLTILFLALSVFLVLKNGYKKGFQVHRNGKIAIALYFGILFVAIGSLLYTPSSLYAYDKLLRMIVITSWCFIGPFFIFRSEDSVKRFFLGYVVLAIFLAFTSFQEFMLNASGTIGFVESSTGLNYIQLGRAVALGSLILLGMFLFEKKLPLKILYFVGSLFLVMPLFFSGGRLPVLAYIIAILCIPFFYVKYKKQIISFHKAMYSLGAYLFFFVITGIAFLASGYANTLLFRMEKLFAGDNIGESSERLIRYDTAYQMIQDNLFLGQGLGSFPIWHNGVDLEDTPHNIFLELFSELGLVSVVLFAILLILAARNGIVLAAKNAKYLSQTQLINITLFVFMLVTAVVSGSINGSKIFYPFIALMIVSPYLKKKTEVEE